jgi:hypothetical protein
MQDIRNRYLAGDRAMIPNLPTAPCRDIAGDADISVRDCIKDMLVRGVPIELYGTWEKPYTGSTVSIVRQCKAMQAMIQRARDVYPGKNVVCIPVFDWRDDADPAVSVKSNRQLYGASKTRFHPRVENKMALTTHTLLDWAARNKTTILSKNSILPS